VGDFLQVVHCSHTNQLSISHRFWDTTSYRQDTWCYLYSSLFDPQIWQLPFEFLDGVRIPSRGRITPINREIIFRLSQCTWSQSTNVTDGRTYDGQTTYSLWVKKSSLKYLTFFHFFHKRLRIFHRCFTHPLYIPIYGRIQIFIQLSPTLTKLCHIKRDNLVHIICSKCPPSTETHAFRRLRKSLIALSVASHYKINTFMMSTNMSDMTWRQQWRHLLSKQA